MNRFAIVLAAAVLITAPLSQAVALDKVQISASSVALGYAPIYVAQEMGYFKQMNIEAEIIPSSSGPASIAAVMSGDMQTVLGAASTMSNARRAGGDIVMFSALATVFGAHIVMSKKWADDHKITAQSSLKDKAASMKGMTIAISAPGGAPDQLIRFLADQAGLNADRDMTIVTISDTNNQITAYSQGRIDGLSAASPTAQAAVRNFGGLVAVNNYVGDVPLLKGYFGATIAARSDWLLKNADLVTRFMKAVTMAMEAMHDPSRTGQARDAVRKARLEQTDSAFFAELWVDAVAATPKTPDITKPMMEAIMDFNNKYTKDKLDEATIQAVYTNVYAEKARMMK